MFDFLKRLFRAAYDCTIGGIVRLCQHTQASSVDGKDKEVVGRLIIYTGYFVFACFFPGLAILIGLLRFLVVTDFIRMLADIFQHTANSYAE